MLVGVQRTLVSRHPTEHTGQLMVMARTGGGDMIHL